jgi:hypothetical protein
VFEMLEAEAALQPLRGPSGSDEKP